MNVDLSVIVQTITVLTSAVLVTWKFSNVAVELRGLSDRLKELIAAHASEAAKGEATRIDVARLDESLDALEQRVDALEQKE